MNDEWCYFMKPGFTLSSVMTKSKAVQKKKVTVLICGKEEEVIGGSLKQQWSTVWGCYCSCNNKGKAMLCGLC